MGKASEPARVIEVKAMDGYRVWLSYSDGIEGIVNLSDMVEHVPFAPWKDKDFFATAVHADEWGGIRWSDDLDFCRNALYMEITGKSPEDVLVGLRGEVLHGS